MITADVRDFAERVLGRFEVSADCSWEHRASSVLRLRDPVGTSWFLKRHSEPERYAAELSAYRNWVPALRDRAPRLHAYDDALHTILLSEVPGRSALDSTAPREDVHHQAGILLRAFHDAEVFAPWTDFAAEKAVELEPYLDSGLIPRHAADFIQAELRALDGIATRKVPCHLDYNLRNWIVHGGRVNVVDFEWSRPDAWLSDLTRLELQSWQTDPGLKVAFLDGYGRTPDADDEAVLRICCAMNTVFLIVRSHRYGMTEFEAGNREILADLTR